MGRAAGPSRAVVGPDPPADRAGRLARARRLARRDRGRRQPRSARAAQALQWFRAAKDGVRDARRTPTPTTRKRRLAMVEDLLKVIPAGALGDPPRPRARALCSIRERKRLRPIVDQALAAGRGPPGTPRA